MADRPISFRWSEEFVAALDAARGDVPRSRFVREAVEAAIRYEEDEGILTPAHREAARKHLPQEPILRPNPNVMPARAPTPGLLPGQRKPGGIAVQTSVRDSRPW